MRSSAFIVLAMSSLLTLAASTVGGAADDQRTRNILFQYQNSSARQVTIIGDFNNWRSEPMRPTARGIWTINKSLAPGVYRYVFIVDKRAVPDPWNKKRVKAGKYSVSVLTVSSLASRESQQQPQPSGREVVPQGTPDERSPSQVSLRSSYSEESTPFYRWTNIARGEFFPMLDTRVRLEILNTRFKDDFDSITRNSAGLGIIKALVVGLYADARYRLHTIEQESSGEEWMFLVAGHPKQGQFETHLGMRKYPAVDTPSSLFEDIAFMEGSGSGGSTIQSIEDHLSIREVVGGVGWTPENFFLYAEGTSGDVSDGNYRRNVSLGGGGNLLAPLGRSFPSTLYAFMDVSQSEYAYQVPSYSSSLLLRTYSPGLSWRLTLSNGFVLGAEGGRTVSKGNHPANWGSVVVRVPITSGISLDARAQTSSDTVYRMRGLQFSLNGKF